MTNGTQHIGFLRRLWQFLLKTSEVAVAGHYYAPWLQAETAPGFVSPAVLRDGAAHQNRIDHDAGAARAVRAAS